MKPMNYYAQGHAWKMPRWLMVVLGTALVVTVTAQGWLMRTLLKPPTTAVALQPATAIAPEASAAVPAAADEAPAAVAPAPMAHHKVARAAHRGVAHPRLTDAKARTILAHHDSSSKRRARDDLDRLMGN